MKKANIWAGVAFVVGVAGLQLYAHELKKELQGGELQSLLIVTQDHEVGSSLTLEGLASLDVPSDYVDARRISSKERENLAGVAVQTRLRAGDSLLWSDLADGAARNHLAQMLLPGRRAYSIKASANPLGKLLRVGDHVDVLVEEAGMSSALLERVLVLAVGSRLGEIRDENSTAYAGAPGVTLSVSSAQAKRLLEAEAQGRLRLVLRNPEDAQIDAQVLSARRDPSPTKSVRASAEAKQEIEHVR